MAKEVPPQWEWKAEYMGPPADPISEWRIVNNDTLIFFKNAENGYQFEQDLDTNLELAAYRWNRWFGSLQAGPFNTHCIGEGTMRNLCLEREGSPWLDPLPGCNDDDGESSGTNATTGTESLWSSVLQSASSSSSRPTRILVLAVLVLIAGILVARAVQQRRSTLTAGEHVLAAQTDDGDDDEGTALSDTTTTSAVQDETSSAPDATTAVSLELT